MILSQLTLIFIKSFSLWFKYIIESCIVHAHFFILNKAYSFVYSADDVGIGMIYLCPIILYTSKMDGVFSPVNLRWFIPSICICYTYDTLRLWLVELFSPHNRDEPLITKPYLHSNEYYSVNNWLMCCWITPYHKWNKSHKNISLVCVQ